MPADIISLILILIALLIFIGLLVGTVALCTWVIKRIWKGKEPKTKEE